MTLSGVSKMRQKQAKFGAFGADIATHLDLPLHKTSENSSETSRFSAAC